MFLPTDGLYVKLIAGSRKQLSSAGVSSFCGRVANSNSMKVFHFLEGGPFENQIYPKKRCPFFPWPLYGPQVSGQSWVKEPHPRPGTALYILFS